MRLRAKQAARFFYREDAAHLFLQQFFGRSELAME